MKVLTVAVMKGGAGKTTTALALSAAFAEMNPPDGLRVGILDSDPQANSTLALGLLPVEEPWNENPVGVKVKGLRRGSISVIRSGRTLDLEFSSPDEIKAHFRRGGLKLDLLIVDAPPGSQLLNRCALSIADVILIPVDGPMTVPFVSDTVSIARGMDGTPPIRVFLTSGQEQYNFARDARDAVDEILPGSRLPVTISFSPRTKEAPSYGLPITIFDRSCSASVAYRKIAREIYPLLFDTPAKDPEEVVHGNVQVVEV